MVGAVVVGLGAWRIYVSATEKPGKPAATGASTGSPSAGSSGGSPNAAATADAQLAISAGDAGTAPAAEAGAAQAAIATPDAATTAMASPDARLAGPTDADKVAAAPADAGTSAGAALAPGAAANPMPIGPSGPGDTLSVASTPAGARVFLDGADTGATPVKLPGSPDRHTISLLLAGHELYVAQVDGHGTFQIPLKEVTPTNGPAGIKVLRCKDKDRYYVFVDGKPTGQTCPTERIGCDVGPHTVEVYDVVSETRRKWDIVVKDTRLSFRVRVE
jgi:hypothetical protein